MKKKPCNESIARESSFHRRFRKSGLVFIFSFLLAINSIGANVFQGKVSINLGQTTIKEALSELQRLTSQVIIYSDDSYDLSQKININILEKDTEEVLNEILKDSPLTYRMMDDYIMILKRKGDVAQEQVKGKKISGKVVDEDGLPLPGVSVMIKGTNLGMSTNKDGNFELNVPDVDGLVLVFTFIGMKKVEIKYTNQEFVRIVMEELSEELEDVVITGFQVVDKRMLTSSVSTLRAEDLDRMGALTVDQMLEGKAPGLMIMNTSAQPGAAPKVRVRAGGTFTGSREPLWVVDGVIYEDPVPLSAAEINSLDNVNLIGNAIMGINPVDIESINILKDASATAVYGTRASNGVIVISTKRGKSGNSRFSYTGSLNIVDRPRYSNFKLMNSKERVDVSREMYERGLNYPGIWPNPDILLTPQGYEKALLEYWQDGDHSKFQNEVTRLEKLNYNWFKEVYQPAYNQQHSLSFSGGTDYMRYYISLGYDNQKGTEKGVNVKRLTARSNIDINFKKNVLFSINLDGSVQESKYNHSSISAFNNAYYKNRAIAARDDDGELIFRKKLISQSRNSSYENYFGMYNEIHERENSARKIDNKSINAAFTVTWDIIEDIKVSTRLGYRNTTNIEEQWAKENTFYMAKIRGFSEFSYDLDPVHLQSNSQAPFGGIYSNGQTSQENYSIRNQINLRRMVADEHYFNLNVSQEASSTRYNGATNWESPGYYHELGRRFSSLPNGEFDYHKEELYEYQAMLKWFTGQGQFNVYPRITERKSNMLSWVGIFTYSFSDRYIANFNIRSDGSNTFGQYERYKFRPSWSASARWNVHNEAFVKTVNYINELALRVSYGFRGSTPYATPYLILSNYGYGRTEFYPEKTATISDYPNGNLKWETTRTTNVGLNFSFLNNRLNGSVDYAYSKSKDLLQRRQISLVNGKDTELYNNGSKDDHTIEVDLRADVIKTKTFQWTVNANFTHIKENVLTGTNVEPGQISIQDYLNGNIQLKGFPIDGFYSYYMEKLDSIGNPYFPGFQRGDYKNNYEKLQEVLIYEGTRMPKLYGGFGTEFRFKGFTLTSHFSYKLGHKVRLLKLYGGDNYLPLSEDNMRKEFVDRWRNPGDEEWAIIPALSATPPDVSTYGDLFLPDVKSVYEMFNLSNVRTAKGDYIRWNSLTLSYRVPSEYIKKIGCQNANIRLQVQNLGVWGFDKKLKGQDPEQMWGWGLPTLRSYNIGIDFSF